VTARFFNFAKRWRKPLSALIVSVLLSGTVLAPGSARATDVSAADPQPEGLSQGLSVQYYYQKFRHLDELVEYMSRKEPGDGDPLPNLDYVLGEGKLILTTEYNKYVGADINGFINFSEPGTWNLVVVSNDGVRLWIDDKLLYEDPDVHADRESDMIPVTISDAGWHAIRVLYFQRKGSSALILGWEPPGGEIEVVPPEAFGHMSE